MDFAELNLIIRSQDVEKADKRQRDLIESGKGVEAQSKRMTSSSEALGNAYGKLLGLIAKLTTAYASLRLVWTGLSDAAKMESMQIIFTKLIGNGERAKNLLLDIQKIADNSMLEFTPLANAGKRMLSLGIAAERVVPLLTSVGEAVSVLGEQSMEPILDAFSKFQAGMKVSTREMQMMQVQGVPAWEMLAKAIGESKDRTMELVGRGAVGGQTAIQGFLAEFQREYGGTMKALDNSTEGLFQSLKDNVQLMLREMGQGMIEAFDVRGTLAPMVAATEQWRGLLGDVVRIMAGYPPVFRDTAHLADQIARAIKAIGAGVAVFLAIQLAIKAVTAAMWLFNTALAANPLLFLIAAATAAIIYLTHETVRLGDTTDTTLGQMTGEFEQYTASVRRANDQMTIWRGFWSDVGATLKDYTTTHGWKTLSGALDKKNVLRDIPGTTASSNDAAGPSRLQQLEDARTKAMIELNEQQFAKPGYTPANQVQREAYERWKSRRAALEGTGVSKPGVEDEYFAAKRQLTQMQQDADLQLRMLGMTNDQREIEAARLRISRLELKGVDEETRHYIETLEKLQEAKKLEEVAQGIGNAFGQAFEDSILAAKSFGEVIKALFMDIERAVINTMATKPLAQGISGFIASMMGLGGNNAYPGTGGPLGDMPNGITGADLVASRLGNLFSNGRLVPFAMGGVVGGPTYFPMAGGKMGVMGEGGPEAVMPLERGADGKLGVRGGGNVYVTITTPDANSFRKSKGQIYNEIRSAIRRGG